MDDLISRLDLNIEWNIYGDSDDNLEDDLLITFSRR